MAAIGKAEAIRIADELIKQEQRRMMKQEGWKGYHYRFEHAYLSHRERLHWRIVYVLLDEGDRIAPIEPCDAVVCVDQATGETWFAHIL